MRGAESFGTAFLFMNTPKISVGNVIEIVAPGAARSSVKVRLTARQHRAVMGASGFSLVLPAAPAGLQSRPGEHCAVRIVGPGGGKIGRVKLKTVDVERLLSRKLGDEVVALPIMPRTGGHYSVVGQGRGKIRPRLAPGRAAATGVE